MKALHTFTTAELRQSHDPVLKRWGVYRIWFQGSDRFYIGSTGAVGGFQKRFREHCGTLRRGKACNKVMQNVYDKYGIAAFRADILEFTEQTEVRTAELRVLTHWAGDPRLMNHVIAAGERWTFECSEQTKGKLTAINAKPFTLEHAGVVYSGTNLTAFAKERNLHQGALTQVLLGRKRQFKGWTLPGKAIQEMQVVDPQGVTHTVLRNQYTSFARAHALIPGSFRSMMLGKRRVHCGWHLPGIHMTEDLKRQTWRPKPSDETKEKRAKACTKSTAKAFTVYKNGQRYDGVNRAEFCRTHGMKSSSAINMLITGARKQYCGFTLHPVSQ